VALAFYTELLGMTVRADRPADLGGGAWLDAGDQQLHLIVGAVPSAHGQHFALSVDDLDAAAAELHAAGTAVATPVPIGTARQAFLTDPDGNAIELHEPSMSVAQRS
jgi:catechol 2,3-dioxygenase-like lactoylglutathione lyase family enzyme